MENQKDKKVREMYTEAPYPFVSFKHFDNFKQSFLETLEGVSDLSDFSNKRILDAGCGTGEKSCILASISKEVVGVDVSKESLKRAEENCKRMGLNNVIFIEDSLLSLQKINNHDKFDVVFCSGVLHHMSDPYLGFQNILKFLKPGGLLIISLYHPLGLFWYRCKYILINLLAGNDENKRLNFALKLFYRGANINNQTVRSKVFDAYVHPQIDFFSTHFVYVKWFLPNNILIKNVYAKYTGIRFILNHTSKRKIKTKLRLIDIGYLFVQKGFVFISGTKTK